MEIIGYIQLYMRFEMEEGPRYGMLDCDFQKPITKEALENLLAANVKAMEAMTKKTVEKAYFITKDEYEKETAGSAEEVRYVWNDRKKE